MVGGAILPQEENWSTVNPCGRGYVRDAFFQANDAAKKVANRNTLRPPVARVNRFRVRMVREDAFPETGSQPAYHEAKASPCLKPFQQTSEGMNIRTVSFP